MLSMRAFTVIISSVGRNISVKHYSNISRISRCYLSHKKILTTRCEQIHTSNYLFPSEAAAERTDGASQTNSDQYDELDSKIGKYVELASDSEQKKKILMILMEHEVAKLEGKRVPSKISVQDMKELLYMYSFSSRVKYMTFLFEREMRRDAEKRKKEFKRKEREAWLVEKENLKPAEHIQYGIGHNTMVLRVRKKSVYRHYNQRLANAVMFDQKIIVDMDYDCFMRKQDCTNCGEQLLELYSANRKSLQPYDLHFCNVDLSSTTMAALQKFMPNLYSPDNFITLSELSYLDLFPKEKLVYITPFAKEPLKKYDHNAVYILVPFRDEIRSIVWRMADQSKIFGQFHSRPGHIFIDSEIIKCGLVDKCIKEPVVLAKAKREGIRAVHLPYDEYLMWGRSNKSLPLNHIIEILLEMKATNDWNKAFRFVPQRKLVRSLDLFSEF